MTGLEQMVKWLEKEPDFIYKDYKDIRTAKMMSFKACIDKARALLAEEQSQPPANADLVGELEKTMALINPTNYPEDFLNGYARAIDDLKEILK